jgi:hypothetical protein
MGVTATVETPVPVGAVVGVGSTTVVAVGPGEAITVVGGGAGAVSVAADGRVVMAEGIGVAAAGRLQPVINAVSVQINSLCFIISSPQAFGLLFYSRSIMYSIRWSSNIFNRRY